MGGPSQSWQTPPGGTPPGSQKKKKNRAGGGIIPRQAEKKEKRTVRAKGTRKGGGTVSFRIADPRFTGGEKKKGLEATRNEGKRIVPRRGSSTHPGAVVRKGKRPPARRAIWKNEGSNRRPGQRRVFAAM